VHYFILSNLDKKNRSMTSINFVSSVTIATSTIRSQELKLFDRILNSTVQLAASNGILLVNDETVQGGGAGSVSSISTFQLFTSTLQISPFENFNATALFTFDCIGSGRFTDLVSTSRIFFGSQFLGIQFG
jgi:AICAR transformylase/IMP cyclohydrolase PurH